MRRSNTVRTVGSWLAVILAMVICSTCRADPIQTYVALGDGLAFGQTTAAPQPSYGNQGYVAQFANFLGTQNNGVVPNVINLAISGETSATYFSADNSGSASRQAGADANLNYGGDATLSQRSFLAGVSAAERAAGRTISTVSFALGLGDFLSLTNSPGFSQMPLAGQIAAVQQMLSSLKDNYMTALGQIRGVLPNAQLYLLNYYNPYSALGPGNPTNQLYTTFAVGQDQLIRSLAPQYNAKIVDLLSTVSSNPANFNNTGSGFPYPTAAGYSAIANQVISVATVPEPGTLSLLACGVFGLAGYGWCRRRPA